MFANNAAISSGLNVLFGSDKSGIGGAVSTGASVVSPEQILLLLLAQNHSPYLQITLQFHPDSDSDSDPVQVPLPAVLLLALVPELVPVLLLAPAPQLVPVLLLVQIPQLVLVLRPVQVPELIPVLRLTQIDSGAVAYETGADCTITF